MRRFVLRAYPLKGGGVRYGVLYREDDGRETLMRTAATRRQGELKALYLRRINGGNAWIVDQEYDVIVEAGETFDEARRRVRDAGNENEVC